LANWDGEEYGLFGSTNWVESNKDMLKKTVAYLNVDVGVSGNSFSVGSTPSLNAFIRELTSYVNDPGTGTPINTVWDGSIPPLGAGSDYSAFIHGQGVPSLEMGFRGGEGVYHSNYDSYTWMNLVDPNFVYHVAIAQLWGSMAIALADSSVAPLYYPDTATALQSYFVTIKQSLSGYLVSPVDLTPLQTAITSFGQKSYQYQASVTNAINSNQSIQDSRSINLRLYATERLFLNDAGLPFQYYFKHTIQAPGLSTGYSSVTFPGVTYAIYNSDWALAGQQIAILSDRINAAGDNLSDSSSDGKSYNAAVVVLSVVLGISLVAIAFLCFRLRHKISEPDYYETQ